MLKGMNRDDQSVKPYPPALNLRLVGHDEIARYDALMALPPPDCHLIRA